MTENLYVTWGLECYAQRGMTVSTNNIISDHTVLDIGVDRGTPLVYTPLLPTDTR